jgi:toxin ParE1/3/4
MRIRFTRQAQRDLDDIYMYLDQRSPAAARTVTSLITRRVADLADFPFIAPQTSVKGIYELTIVRYPYKVNYEVDGDEVQILHIRDSRREPWKPTCGERDR